jgi:hypothetical protein
MTIKQGLYQIKSRAAKLDDAFGDFGRDVNSFCTMYKPSKLDLAITAGMMIVGGISAAIDQSRANSASNLYGAFLGKAVLASWLALPVIYVKEKLRPKSKVN